MEAHDLVRQLVLNGRVRFTAHALERCRDRQIAPDDVLLLLANNAFRIDKREATQFATWGDHDGRRFRIVTRHVEPYLLVITVIHES